MARCQCTVLCDDRQNGKSPVGVKYKDLCLVLTLI